MQVNFGIKDNHAIIMEGVHIDLHNNFDFIHFDYNVAEKQIKLYWKKSSGDWVNKHELAGVLLTHSGVSFLSILGQDEEGTGEDSQCLGDISFYPSTERDVNDSIMLHTTPNDGDDILYFFANGQRIRIHCEQITLVMQTAGEAFLG